MKINLIVVAFAFLITKLHGQSQLSILNPLPRVGQEIELAVSISENKVLVGTGTIKLTEGFSQKGAALVGPFSFAFNNNLYVTDSILVTVEEQLRDVEGVWIRYVNINSDLFLIIEERIPTGTVSEGKGADNLSFSAKRKHFEFLSDKLEELDFEIQTINTSTKIELIDVPHSQNKTTVSYKLEVIKFRKTESSVIPLKIDLSFFTNVRKLDTFWIK